MDLRKLLLKHTERHIADHGITSLERATGIPAASLRRFIRGEGNLALPSIDAMLDVYGLEVRPKPKRAKSKRS